MLSIRHGEPRRVYSLHLSIGLRRCASLVLLCCTRCYESPTALKQWSSFNPERIGIGNHTPAKLPHIPHCYTIPGKLPFSFSGENRNGDFALSFRHWGFSATGLPAYKFSESQHFVLCSDLRTARTVGYTGLILRETQLQLPVTASNKSTQHTYHTLRCRGPFALIHPCIGAYARVKRETLLL